MRKTKVSLEFIRLSVALKILFYRFVLLSLTGNILYQQPDVSLAEAKLAVDNLEIAALAAEGGGPLATELRNQKEKIADDIFHILAAYVERIANGDDAKILASGFNGTHHPIPFTKLPLVINDGLVSGTVEAVMKAIENAGAYFVEYAVDEIPTIAAGWKSAGTSTSARMTISGLPVGSKYYFRMNAITPLGLTDFCDPVSKIII